MLKLEVPVDARNYAGTFGSPVIAVQLDGGAPRLRQDKLGIVHIIDVAWYVGPDDYKYLMAFYRTGTSQGALPFTIDLVIDDSVPEEYTATFVPQTFRLESIEGITFTVRAQLAVVPIAADADADNLIISNRAGTAQLQQ
jgi:hypothetical protein